MPKNRFQSLDKIQIGLVFFLIGLGLMSIYSATCEAEGGLSGLYLKQLMVASVGIFVFITAILLPPRFYSAFAYIFYAISIILLIIVLIINRGEEAARWIRIGSFNFQPSEAAKLSMILALARFMENNRRNIEKFSTTLLCLLIIILPFILVLMEPDLGTAVIFGFIAFPMMLYAGISGLHLLLLVIPFAVIVASFSIFLLLPVTLLFFIIMLRMRISVFITIVVLLFNLALGFSGPKVWNSLHPYQQRRIITFLNPEADPRGAGYQIIQSKIAVGSGGCFGKGYLHGTQGRLKFLPAGHTDFIFSIFSEEFGFLGAGLILIAFFVLVYRGLFRAFRCKNKFNGFLIIGIASHFTFHCLINVGVAIGLLPVTGIPLPFMSYGGSALILNMAKAGIMIGAGMRWKDY